MFYTKVVGYQVIHHGVILVIDFERSWECHKITLSRLPWVF